MVVVSSAHGVFGPLLGKLAALLANECGRLKGVRREIRSLRSELVSMHAALKEYTKLEDPNGQVKTWISLVRELAYDTEDVFDKFIQQLGNAQNNSGFKEFLHNIARRPKMLGPRRGIADQIDDLKYRIKQVKELKDSYKLNEASTSTACHVAVDPRLHALFADEANLVGMEGPRDDLAKWMVEETNTSNHCKVLSIVGFGGLGKTTLANAVFHKIQAHFDCWAFVSVSPKPDIRKIINDVISQVSSQNTSDWDEIKCIAKLRELLKEKRYLVIIDDVWSTQAWTTIKCALPENNYSSRIIATTRIIDVAKSCCQSFDDRVYEMEALSDLNSRRLFFRRIFGSDDRCLDTLDEVSSEILKKCGGLPLAIISISSLLTNTSAIREEWEKVKRSIGYALENKQSLEGMNSILSLSYKDLPPNLKPCLLYLSMFPEDCVIERERLVRLWIAEGFICEELGKSCQETAENYFDELVNRSMVQPVGIDCDGKARACRVHGIMLGFIISESAKDNFTMVVGIGERSLSNRGGFIRRLSVQHIDREFAFMLANEDLSHVRSLTIASSVCTRQLPGLVNFEALCVLDFDDCEGLEEYTASGMDKLSQLKYLRLGGKTISKLPPGIVMLHDLVVLDLRGTNIKELPAEIVQLTEIQELHISSETWTKKGKAKIPDGIGNMRMLQAVSGFSITDSSIGAVEELGNLTNLSELHIELNHGGSEEYNRHEEMLLSSLIKLGTSNLRSLWIHKCRGLLEFLDSWSPAPSSLETFRTSGGCCFTNIPRWISSALTRLVHLEISLPEFKEEGLHTLGELPALGYLKLSFVADPVEVITVQGTTGFPCLNKFTVYSVAGGHVTFMEGAMPKLEKLNVRLHVSLAKNYDFHLGIQHLPCLMEVAVCLYEVDATASEIRAAAAAIRNEACIHPKRPRTDISGKCYERQCEEISSDEEDLR